MEVWTRNQGLGLGMGLETVVGVIIKGNKKDAYVVGTIQCFDCGGGYTNLHS